MRMRYWWLLVVCLLGCETTPQATPPPSETPTATATPQIGVAFATRAQPTIAIVQVTPTPLPTATPTPSPTPVTYTIADGDTVWSIAYLNGTVPDELLALNPQVQPELLKVGDKLVLPPPATPIYQDVGGTPIPLQIRVANLQLYTSPVGSLWIVGEVENLGSFSAENVQVEISLYSQDNTPLGSVTAWVAPGIVAAGGKAPFGTLLRDVTALSDARADGGYNTTASIIAGKTLADAGSRTVAFEIEDEDVVSTSAQTTVSGTIKNLGADSAENIQIVATLYDTNGNVSGFYQHSLPEALEPEASAAFEFSIAPPGGMTVDVQILAQGVTVSE